jgi:hypothetical protein
MKKLLQLNENSSIDSSSSAQRPLSSIGIRVAMAHLKLKSEEGKNPQYRYQFNPRVNNSKIDQQKAGHFLRNKYSNLGLVMGKKRKNDRNVGNNTSDKNSVENPTKNHISGKLKNHFLLLVMAVYQKMINR